MIKVYKGFECLNEYRNILDFLDRRKEIFNTIIKDRAKEG